MTDINVIKSLFWTKSLIYSNNIELTADREVEEWGDCLPDCPTQITNPVCLMDPVPPALQDGYQGSKNYTTDFDFGVGTVTKGVLLGYSSTFL